MLRRMPRMRLFVEGSVQGVGFRFFTSRTANNLGIKGFVRNLADGRVEIVAEGEKNKLKKLMEFVKQGPITARVERVIVQWEHETGEFKTFEVRF